MKYIFIVFSIFLTSSLYAQSCGDGTEAGVNTCTLNEKFFTVFERLYPNIEGVDEDTYNDDSTNRYYYDYQEPETRSLYERLVMESKPAESVFDAELVVWKGEEVAKIQWRNRVYLESEEDFKLAAYKCGYSQPNMALLRKDIHDQNDTVKMDCIDSKIGEVNSEQAAETTRLSRVKLGNATKVKAEQLYSLIVGINQQADPALTDVQLGSLLTKFGHITESLNNYFPSKACADVANVTPDPGHETLLKTEVLNECSRLGY